MNTAKLGFQHVILMRFNVRNSLNPRDREIPIRSRPGWLEGRFELFERYCLPTIVGQSNQNFNLHIYFDSKTPDRFIAHAERCIAGAGNISLEFCELYSMKGVKGDLAKLLDGACRWLLTTRLDNDDGIHRDFVAMLQDEVHIGRREALNFPLGIIFRAGRIYISRQPCNAFLSLSESYQGFTTVLCAPHNEIGKYVPVRDIRPSPSWLQVIHESNVSNKARGRRIMHGRLPEGFEAVKLVQDKSFNENHLGVVLENTTIGMIRITRDAVLRSYRAVRGGIRG